MVKSAMPVYRNLKRFWRFKAIQTAHELPQGAIWLLTYNTLTTFGTLFGIFYVVYLTSAKGITISQAFTLQSVFLATSLIAEVPTGVIADKVSRKLSVILGDLLFALSFAGYFLAPSYSFLIGMEILAGIGRAFISGAFQALEFDIFKAQAKTALYDKYLGLKNQAYLLASIATAGIGALVVRLWGLPTVPIISALFIIVALLPIIIWVKEPKMKHTQSFSPNYIQIIKTALAAIKQNQNLRVILSFIITYSIFEYFVWWTSQSMWTFLMLPAIFYSITTTVKQITGILFNSYFVRLLKRFSRLGLIKKMTLTLFLLLVFSLLTLKLPNFGVILNALSLSIFAGILAEFYTVTQSPLQKHIPSKVRSTVLSLQSLLFSTGIIILNPIIGKAVDILPVLTFYTFTTLGLIAIWIILTQHGILKKLLNED